MDTYQTGALKGKRYFDPKTKAEIVAKTFDNSLSQVSRETGVAISTLSTWRKRARGKKRAYSFATANTGKVATPKQDNNLALARSLIETALGLLKSL